MNEKSNNKTWWKFDDTSRIDVQGITEIAISSVGEIYIYRDGLEATLVFHTKSTGYAQAQALLEYIDKELCINVRQK